jgi:hypothetical protein
MDLQTDLDNKVKAICESYHDVVDMYDTTMVSEYGEIWLTSR